MKHGVTPELALVDPELARTLRALLPDPPDCLAPRLRARLAVRPALLGPPRVEVPVVPAAVSPRPADRPAAPLSIPPLSSPPPSLVPAVQAAPPGEGRVAPLELEPAAGRAARSLRPFERGNRIAHYAAVLSAWCVALGIFAVPLLAFVPPPESERPSFVVTSEPAADRVAGANGSRATFRSKPPRATTADAAKGRTTSSGVKGSHAKSSRAKPAHAKTTPAKPSSPRTATAPRTSTSDRTRDANAAAARKAKAAAARKAKAAAARKAKAAAAREAKAAAARRAKAAAARTARKRAAQKPVTATHAARAGTLQPLSWREVRDADLYNVVFVHGQKRVDRWVKDTSLAFAARPGAGRDAQSLQYRWYVYPLFRQGKGYRYGPLVARGAVRLDERVLAATG